MNNKKQLKLRIENDDEVQSIFSDLFRTMGKQMGPSFSKEARKGSFSVSSAVLDKSAETWHKGGLFFHVDVESSPLWEIDFENKVVTVPVKVVVAQGLSDAIDYFEDEKNRVVLQRYRQNLL